ncbi:PAS domain S-box protein [Acidobacteriota bacterium]
MITQEFLNNILESMEGGVLTVNLEGQITSFNLSAVEITGYSKEDALGKDCRDILRSEICEDACPLEETIKSGKPVYNYEVLLKNKSGKKVPVNITSAPLRDSSDNIIGVVENFRDLTKHEGLWGRLREERNRAQRYLNIAGVIIVAINENGLVTLINRKGTEVLGFTESEILGNNWFDLCVPEKLRQKRKQTHTNVMAGETKEIEDYENLIVTKSGEERIIDWHNTTLTDDKGRIIGTLSSGEDITMRKHTEAELIRTEKLASLGQLAASVAHEVNNPIAGILVYVSLLLKKYNEKKIQTETTETQLLKMKKELERTARIIKNLLNFSRQSEPNIRPIEVNATIEASLQLVEHQISLESIQLEKKLDPNLPSIQADFDKIQQVLINIILNATQAMSEGGTLTITTSVAGEIKVNGFVKDTVRIDITDTGIGISEENINKLFTPFFTTKAKGQGVGLGLPVVQGIIKQHGGRIDVVSKPNQGTTFTLFLEVSDGK